MYRIVKKRVLNPSMTELLVEAPLVAAKAQPGQFVILRPEAESERIPLTVAGTDPEKGTVKIIFQTVGKTTLVLQRKEEGDEIHDFAGPLGLPTDLSGVRKTLVIGGGAGCAIALPIAEALHRSGAEVTSVVGFRNKDLLILKEEFEAASDRLIVMTDDGSYGRQGNVTLPEKEMLEQGVPFDRIIAIGPLIMMKFVVETARPFSVPVTVSMNPVMIDGTGMCGCCRLTLLQDGQRVTKFACVDGPDFDGYEVDFDEAMSRNRMYQDFERHAYEEACNLLRKAENSPEDPADGKEAR